MVMSKPMSLANVLREVQCEIVAAYKANDKVGVAFKGLSAAGQYTTSGEVSLSGDPSLTIEPANVPASVKLPLGANASSTATTSSEFDFNIDLNMLATTVQKGAGIVDLCDQFLARVKGEGLGITQHLTEAAGAVTQSDTFASTPGLVYDVKFKGVEGANGGLSFTTIIGSVEIGKPSITDTDTNELKLTLAAASGGDSGGKGGGKGGGGGSKSKLVPFLFDSNKLIQVAPGQTITIQ